MKIKKGILWLNLTLKKKKKKNGVLEVEVHNKYTINWIQMFQV